MSVTILCPNGRRQTMKVTPNTSILEILEFVCKQQNFDSQEYGLFRNNKSLDLSLTIRFANIPNNGQLDLKPVSVKRTDEKVMLAIDVEAGERKVQEFDSKENLWNIIHHLFDKNSILNLEQNHEFCIIYIGKEISGEKQLKETNLRSLGLMRGRAAMKLIVRAVSAVREQAFVESLNLKKPLELSKESVTRTERQNISKPSETQKTNEETKHFSKPLDESHSIEKNKGMKSTEELESKPKKIDIPMEAKNTIKKSDSVEKMEVQSEESSDESEEEVVNYLRNRNEILFKMSDLPKVSKIDFPDEFYETTKDDLVSVLSDLRKQQVGNNERLLETKQMREKRMKDKLRKYKSTVIRVCFPNDKLVFQAIFKPNDTVKTVMEAIGHYVQTVDYYLYTVPPKRQLNPESNLFDLDLIPAAVVHFGTKSDTSGQNVIKEEFRTKITSYKSAAKIAITARKDLISVINNESIPSTQPLQQLPSPPVESQNVATGRPLESGSGQRETKVPKWFKTNK